MIKYCDIMNHDAIIQELAPLEDLVVSTVECTWEELFRILALVEHSNPAGHSEPKQWAILVFGGRAPIRSSRDVELTNILPISGSAFSCQIDIETGQGVNVRLSANLLEPEMLFKLASGNRTQNFIDEVFRAAQCSCSYEQGGITNPTLPVFPWLAFYENLMKSGTSQSDSLHHSSNQSLSSAPESFTGAPFGEDDSSTTSLNKNPSDNNLYPYEEEWDSALGGVNAAQEQLVRGMSSLTYRESVIKCVMEGRQEQYTDSQPLSVYIATWNVNGQTPGSICLKEWLARTPNPPDIYAIGFQELDLSKEVFLFNDTPLEGLWLDAVTEGLHTGASYKKVKLIRLIGMMLIVFVKSDIARQLREVSAESVGTGLMGRMGNKGGVAVRFRIGETSLCFVNCHLAAHVEEFQRRNQDYRHITERMLFTCPDGNHKYIKDHDQVFWFGDMNYRIDPTTVVPEKAKQLIENERFDPILDQDQLKMQMKLGHVFPGFCEGRIAFRPTYKYDPGTDNWDSSEKHRTPAWCDRVLWKGSDISQWDYISLPQYKLSDHKPVSSTFVAKVKFINQEKYRKVYEDALKRMDKLENEFLPQVTVDIPGAAALSHSNRNEIHFGIVKFLEPVKKAFTIANTGQVPVRLEFIKKLNDIYVCKEWLRIEPHYSFIKPGETCEIELEILVDKKTAGVLNVGKDSLYDILVLHLENGKDIFVTVAADYERSVFGASITALVNMPQPFNLITPGQLIELEKGEMPLNHYDIPKELWFLVDRLVQKGKTKPFLFNQSGLHEEILQIRDWLNTIPNAEIPGSIDSVAEALLLFLECFPEPVIPFSLHLKCLDSASNYTACKQIVKQLPPAHRNVFVYLSAFLRELLNHSDSNGLDAKCLALLFGRVLLRDKHHTGKPNQRMERQKATFVYQFLVNEEYLDDKS